MSFSGKLPDLSQINFKDIASTTAGVVPSGYLGVVLRSGKLYSRTAVGLETPIAGISVPGQGDNVSTINVGSFVIKTFAPTFTQCVGLSQIINSNAYVMAITSGVSYSADGQHFPTAGSTPFATPVSVASSSALSILISASQYSQSTNGVAWGAASALGTTAANKIFFLNNAWFVITTTGVILRSPDGTTWTTVYTHPSSRILIDMTFSPTLNLFVCVGGVNLTEGIIVTSTNGTAWTLRTSPSNNAIQSVCATLTTTRLVAGGNSGAIMWSDDGTTWNTATGMGSVNTMLIWHVAATTNGFNLVISNGGYYTSTTGTSWSLQSQVNNNNFSAGTPVQRSGRMSLQQGWYGDSSYNVYLTPKNPGQSPLSAPQMGVSLMGSFGGVSFRDYNGTNYARFTQQGAIFQAAATDEMFTTIQASGVQGYAGETQVFTAVSSSTTLNSNVALLSVSPSTGLWRIQATIHFECNPSASGTNQYITVGIGNSAWVVGTSGGTFRPGENYCETFLNQAIGNLPARFTVVCPSVVAYYSPAQSAMVYVLPNGNTTSPSSTFSIVGGIYTTSGGLTSANRRVFVVCTRII